MVKELSPPKRGAAIRRSSGDRMFFVCVNIVIIPLTIVILYPLIYVLAASFSSVEAVTSGQVFLWPVDFSLEGYKAVFETDKVLTGYRNSFIYLFLGTLINVALTLLAAYPLSRRDLVGHRFFTLLFSFTMVFNGGMIPMYILVTNLRMINTVWAMVIPNAISVYNMIITRTFMNSSIPPELLEAAKMDGCSDIGFFFRMVLPLSKAVIAVITLYYAIGHWNAYFNAFMYLTKDELQPLQIVLREILLMNRVDPSTIVDPELAMAKAGLVNLLKYSLIVVATAPVLVFYPIAQKYFVKGVMIGSLKG